jgi:hypothetical protein
MAMIAPKAAAHAVMDFILFPLIGPCRDDNEFADEWFRKSRPRLPHSLRSQSCRLQATCLLDACRVFCHHDNPVRGIRDFTTLVRAKRFEYRFRSFCIGHVGDLLLAAAKTRCEPKSSWQGGRSAKPGPLIKWDPFEYVAGAIRDCNMQMVGDLC